jgi:hypothetical protein
MKKVIEAAKVALLPVPEGLKIKYQHYYVDARGLKVYRHAIEGPFVRVPLGDDDFEIDGPESPLRLTETEAWLENATFDTVAEGWSKVSKKDVPIKKLGRAIAHNRCIKTYLKHQEEEAALHAAYGN